MEQTSTGATGLENGGVAQSTWDMTTTERLIWYCTVS